jgi:hypothetical protein
MTGTGVRRGGADAYTVREKCCNTPVRIVINTEIHGWKGARGWRESFWYLRLKK